MLSKFKEHKSLIKDVERSPNRLVVMSIHVVVRFYWIGLAGKLSQNLNLFQVIFNRFFAVANGFVSITPIQMDATNYVVLDNLHLHVNG